MQEIAVVREADRRTLAAFDALIDVRSPGEFAEDHIPGAINLPVLDDAERAEVGAIYVQESKFRARRIGAARIAKRVAEYLEMALADRPASFRPLIYCWRGGQRSGAMATILSQIGWRTAVLRGGYKTYRGHVRASLYDRDLTLRLILIDGRTGSGKTDVLRRLPQRGAQILDLEALAQHRGSLFGGYSDAQPSQKLFESRVLAAIEDLDPVRPVYVEAEASKIGDRVVPPALWKRMLEAPRFCLAAPGPERARYLVRAYPDVVRDREKLQGAIARLPGAVGRASLARWSALADSGEYAELAEELIGKHYDPAYDRVSKRNSTPLAVIQLPDLDDHALDRAADTLVAGSTMCRAETSST